MGTWGNSSLVEYLAEAGFTPDEIVEAGLAVRTKQKQQQVEDKQYIQIEDKPKEDQSDKEACDVDQDKQQHDYSGLMDRFRSRLIVPTMDEGGQNVIGLGGRHLETSSDNDGENDKNKKVHTRQVGISTVLTRLCSQRRMSCSTDTKQTWP